MLSYLLALFLALLTVFGQYLAPSPPTRPSPSALPRLAPESASTTVSATTTAKPISGGPAPAVVALKKPVHKTEPASVATLPLVEEPMHAPQPAIPPASAGDFSSATEAVVLAVMNAERAKQGLSALSYDAELARLSREHSADMIARDYFSHEDPEGCASSCRANKADYGWQAIGENIYMSSGYKVGAAEEADMVVDGWMSSPGHRANILGSQYTHAGVGVAVEGESVYVTAMYSNPR